MLNNSSKVAYVFPGQGSQHVGMGYELYENFPSAREVFQEANDALSFNISRLCFEGPEKELLQTVNAQPAILTVSVAYLKMMKDTPGVSPPPSFVAGHSLGEYAALVAAGVVDFSTAIRLVRERGILMQEAGEREAGGMIAVLGLDQAQLEEVCRQSGAQVANINCPGQIVVSGTPDALAAAMTIVKSLRAPKAIALDVSGAFHSSLMRYAQEGINRAVSQCQFNHPSVPIVANTTAEPLFHAEEIKEELTQQLCSCVQWQRSVENMAAAGVSIFIEVGPGRVLSGLIKRIKREAMTISLGDSTGMQEFLSFKNGSIGAG